MSRRLLLGGDPVKRRGRAVSGPDEPRSSRLGAKEVQRLDARGGPVDHEAELFELTRQPNPTAQ
jgi:hypothetical protein